GHAYRFVDRTASPRRSYRYRLQSVSKKGKRAWLGTTSTRARAPARARGSLRMNTLFTAPTAFASSTPQTQFLGDTVGTTFTFSLDNSTGTTPIGAVQVARPNDTWTIIGCPAGPAGWTVTTSEKSCTYRSLAGTAGYLQPGAISNAFQATATTLGGTSDGH